MCKKLFYYEAYLQYTAQFEIRYLQNDLNGVLKFENRFQLISTLSAVSCFVIYCNLTQ
jgi:hypothetical protein